MQRNNPNDTIVAIATPPGAAGIGIVRISGKEALSVADKIFVSKDAVKPSGFLTYTIHYGWIVEPRAEGGTARAEIIDEVILTVMRAPRSYTKEDVVEINCHGGIVSLRRMLDVALKTGCRLAEPGEFTKRAFLNGRIDLAQAEAVLDIIQAKSDAALKMGVNQLKGYLSFEINTLREELLEILSTIEATIDFPEEGLDAAALEDLSHRLRSSSRHLQSLVEASRYGRVLREGIHVVICGKPNTGKSSLLNALLKQERSIVTAIAGTTRDTIEEIIDIRGIPVRIVDTAGILEPRDLIERKAIRRCRQQMKLADLVILLFDGSTRLSKDDALLMKRLQKKVVVAVINKVDLKQKIERERIIKNFGSVVEISAKKHTRIYLLEEAIVNMVYGGHLRPPGSALLSNIRHIQLVKDAQKLIAEVVNSVDNKLSAELVAQGIKDALVYLDVLLGKKFSEDLLDKIFSEFCIGK